MSPEGKAKLDALSNLGNAATDSSVFDEDVDEITNPAVPNMKAAGQTKKRMVTTTVQGGESKSYSPDKSKNRTSKEEGVVRSVHSQICSLSQVMPKANAGDESKHSPISFSPIDYRPQNQHANVAECPETASMLKSYVESWTEPSSDDNVDYSNESNDPGGVDDRKHSKTEADSSSSDMSTSYAYEKDFLPSPSTASDKLDVEYGRLALLKQELELKLRGRALDGASVHDGIVADAPERPSPPLEQQLSTTSNRKDGITPSTTGIREDLEHEYGRLTLFKRQLERKMQMQNFDSIDRRAPFSEFKSVTNHNVVAVRGEEVTRHDEAPSREDVEFGEMVYNQRMAELSRFDVQRRPIDGHGTTQYRGNGGRRGSSPSRHEVGKYGVAKYHTDHDDDNHDTAYGRSYSKTKTKKRRKRRVVETITRVIHEESEEEGSASTGGGRHGTGRSFSPRGRHRDGHHTVYRGKVTVVQPSSRGRERIFLPKSEAHELHNPGRDYNDYEESGSDSSQSIENHERRSYEAKGPARKKSTSPSRERSFPASPEKNWQKPSHGPTAKSPTKKNLTSKFRLHTSQSMLESLR
jgi:hypothetical protein